MVRVYNSYPTSRRRCKGPAQPVLLKTPGLPLSSPHPTTNQYTISVFFMKMGLLCPAYFAGSISLGNGTSIKRKLLIKNTAGQLH